MEKKLYGVRDRIELDWTDKGPEKEAVETFCAYLMDSQDYFGKWVKGSGEYRLVKLSVLWQDLNIIPRLDELMHQITRPLCETLLSGHSFLTFKAGHTAESLLRMQDVKVFAKMAQTATVPVIQETIGNIISGLLDRKPMHQVMFWLEHIPQIVKQYLDDKIQRVYGSQQGLADILEQELARLLEQRASLEEIEKTIREIRGEFNTSVDPNDSKITVDELIEGVQEYLFNIDRAVQHVGDMKLQMRPAHEPPPLPSIRVTTPDTALPSGQ